MTEVFSAMLSWMTKIFDFLLAGGIIGVAIVCWPLYSRIVRAVRSIISR